MKKISGVHAYRSVMLHMLRTLHIIMQAVRGNVLMQSLSLTVANVGRIHVTQQQQRQSHHKAA